MTARFDVAVVGSGIVGLGAAYAAVRRGKSVVVIDRTERPVGSTIRNFGHLCIGAQSGAARTYADASRPIWLRLAQDAGFWLRESGTLVVAREHDELALLDEAAADDEGIRLLDQARVRELAPVRDGVARGGALVGVDLQVNPREAAAAIVRHLTSLGVEFRYRTAVTDVESGRVRTTRGVVDADEVVVAVNHDIDQLLPEIADRAGVIRCALDMMRVAVDLPAPLAAPVLTGWSLVRYRRFAGLGSAAALRERLHSERPALAALDLNQMYTQLPDGTMLLGDSHHKGVQPGPFQPEAAFDAFVDEAHALFDIRRLRVLERWQGVYAAAREELLVEEVAPRVLALAATTGIGMTTGLGLAETETTRAFGWEPADADGSVPDPAASPVPASRGGEGNTLAEAAIVGGRAQEENA
ncbi:TIGR03364 family FAD-dependent oxidoreductase [Microbacterium capsulatum]|uniref:TIGR03364 family FAD-dependent oxidoreductase n=1 Tax=Microbacterium capsulatum TaxID=3041921 RepID=A0ABU0XM43_9MICO|nr:TIGR03364 family FAD-dependent oxidoreductase [Microbacterium sp. ASV81]MDQ4215658.1 TIGR03364 family FAD-dependent oxidoreductase [Microbacterium sp. ASV81]